MANLIIWNCLNEDINASRPLGAHQLSGWLRSHGYTVKVIDFCHALSTDTLVSLTEMHIDSQTVGIGVSSTFWNNINVVNRMDKNFKKMSTDKFFEPAWVIDARLAIEKNHNLEWLLGGASITYSQLGYLSSRFNWVKFYGYAEDSVLKFMDEKSNKTITRRIFDIKTQTNCFYDDLGLMPSETLSLELGRGCQFKCRFCTYPMIGKAKGTYIRDLSFVKEELLFNYEKYGITKYAIMDDTANESTEKIEELANIAQRLPFKLSWVGYNRLDLIGSQPHTVDLLKASGLKSTFFGIESFHPEASKIVGKGWNGKRGKDYIVELNEQWNYEISMTLSFIVGLPYEDEKSLAETHEFCIQNNISSWIYLQLYMNKNFAQSEFEKNFESYGFSFPNPMKNDYWVNDMWTHETAIKKAQELNYDPRRMNLVKPMTWYIPVYSTLGYDFDQVKNIPVNQIDRVELSKRFRNFVDVYVEKQKAL